MEAVKVEERLAVRQALTRAGVKEADFEDTAIDCLHRGNYTTEPRIKAATRPGLSLCFLPPADQDVLLAALGKEDGSGGGGGGGRTGIDMATVSAIAKAFRDELAPIHQALERQSSSTVAASSITSDQLAAVRFAIGTSVLCTSSTDDPEALQNLFSSSSAASGQFWGSETEPNQREHYSTQLRQNLPPSPHQFLWMDARGLVVKIPVRGEYSKLSCKNDELLIVRGYSHEPALGAVLGVEVKKVLTAEKLRQAEAEYYVFAAHSIFPYAQLITDFTSGGVLFYSDKKVQGRVDVKMHTLVGMPTMFAYINQLLRSIPATMGMSGAPDDDFLPKELPTPKRIKLTLSGMVSEAEAIRMLYGIQSYDIACLEDLDDPSLYARPSPGHAPTPSYIH